MSAAEVGKSTFIKAALDLNHLPGSRAAEKRIPYESSPYMLRLLELDLDDIDTNHDGTIDWPERVEDRLMPKIDGALALYSCQEASSIKDLRDMLSESSLLPAACAVKLAQGQMSADWPRTQRPLPSPPYPLCL